MFAAPASAAFNPAVSLSQCTNGGVGPPLVLAPCLNGTLGGSTFADWVNGNANSSKSHWKEGQFISYRADLSGLSSGSHTYTIDYHTVDTSKHAIDYLGSYDATETTSPTAGPENRNDNNPCTDVLGSAAGSGCTAPGTAPTPAATTPVPTANLTGEKTCNGASGLPTTPTQTPGTFDLFAPTAAGASMTSTGASYVSQNVTQGSGVCDTTVAITFNLSGTAPANGWEVVLTWGGHIASALDWGVGNSASAINGSPYHMIQDSIDTTGLGSQDRALMANAVAGPPTVATQVSNTSIAVGSSLTDTATLTGSAGTVTGTVQFQLCSNTTTGCPQGTGLNIGSPVTLSGGTATSAPFGVNPTLTPGNYCVGLVYVNDGLSFYSNTYSGSATNECFTVGKGTSTTATTVFDAATNAAWSGTEGTGASAYDTATVTPSAQFSPTGTVTYTFFTNGTCSGTGASAGTVTLVAPTGSVPKSSTEGPLAVGNYSFQATYSGDSNYAGSTSPCEPFSVGKPSTTTSTTVFDAATNAAWSGTEKTGASAYDTATVGGQKGSIVPTGTVSYTFFTNGTCNGTGASAGTVTLSGTGAVPNSSTQHTLAAGSYSFQASYSGDSNYAGSTSPCEPFSVGGGSSTTATTVFDASTNAPWAGTESTGSSAYDTATVSTSDTVTATGTVSYTFFTNGTCNGTGASAGTVTLTGTGAVPNSSTQHTLAAGSYSFQASYSGDSNYAGSTSPCEPFTVGGGSSTTATTVFDASTNAPWAGTESTGASAYDTATVTSSDTVTATGTVSYTFFANGSCNGSGSPAGTVTLTASGAVPNSSTQHTLAAGSYSFQAVYSGDGNYAGSTSPCEPFTVGGGSSTTATTVFDASTNAPWAGTESTGASAYDTATVATSDTVTATGTVSYTFFPNGTCAAGTGGPAGTVTLDAAGNVPNSDTQHTLAAGNYSFQATYSGDSNYAGSTSGCEPFTVGGGTSTTATTVFDAATNAPWAGTETTGSSAYDTATVTSSDTVTATGTVSYTFFANGSCQGTGASAGTVTLKADGSVPNSGTESTLAAGSYSFQATYSGDANYSGSTSPCEPFTVGGGSSSTATQVFDASTNAPWAGTESTGSSAYDTATVTSSDGITATGTVSYTFFANGSCQGNGSPAGTVSLDGAGNVPQSSTQHTLAAGNYSFQAAYSGDANYSGSTSPCEPFTVGGGTSSTATVVFDAATNAPWTDTETTGSSAYDTATVASSDTVTATGTVSYTFFANGSCQGNGSPTGTVSLDGAGNVPNSDTQHALAAGSYSFQATYSGDTNYSGSTSDCEPFTVGGGTSTTATQVFDASTNAPWAGTESTGSSAYDTATVTTSDGITATGTVNYTFFPNGTCAAGTGTGAGTVTLDGAGNVPNSDTQHTLAAGNYSFQATYSGDSNYSGSTSGCEPFTVGGGTSTTATTVFDAATNAPWAGTESTGSSAYDTATVTNSDTITATGTVNYTFFANGSCQGTGSPAGTVTLDGAGNVPNSDTQHTLAAGAYSFQATYSGDANYSGSPSDCEPFTVGGGTSHTNTVVFDASMNAPWAGTETTGARAFDTATVSTSDTITATGTVSYTFFTTGDCSGTGAGAGTVTLNADGSVPNSNPEGPLTPGNYSFQASYSGDSNYSGSTSPCEPFTVKNGESLTITQVFDAATNAPWTGTESPGASAYDTAHVIPSDGFPPTGTVSYTFFANGSCQGNGSPAGTVTLDGAGNVPNSDTQHTLAAGAYSFQATYSGDANYSGSTSDCEPFTVGGGTSTTATTVFDAATNAPWAGTESTGASAYDTATVTGSGAIPASGTVSYTFFANGSCQGNGSPAGTVTLDAAGNVPNSGTQHTLAAGSYSFQATYSGDSNYSGSTSGCEPFAVGGGSSTTATVVFDAATNAPWAGTESTGSSAYDTATVTSSDTVTATGTVSYTFFANGSCQGSGSPAGTVTLDAAGSVPNSDTQHTLAAGSYSFQASYSGDSNYSGSTSPCEPFTVGGGSSTTATTVFDAATNAPWTGSEATGSSAYDTATVTSSDTVTATGTVAYTFFGNGSCQGSGSPAGTVTLKADGSVPNSNTENALAAGLYSFQAVYSGDSNYSGSTSPCEPFTVGGGPSTTATTVFDAATNAPWTGTETTGSSAYDTATVGGQQAGIPATGTVAYTFFTNGSCAAGTGSPAGTVTLDAAGNVPNSSTEHTLAAGSYSFRATYSGDANYAGSTSPCEPFTVGGGTSTTNTTVFDAATNAPWAGTETIGASAYDTATVTTSDTVVATGTVAYTFFTNGTCSGTGASAGKVTLTAAGAVPKSGTEGPLAAGSYSFQATYSGDANYSGSTGACEPFSVQQGNASASTVVFDAATNAPWAGTEAAGASAYDTATVSGTAGITPTGTVTYAFFTNGTCSGTGTPAGTVTLSGGKVPNSSTEGPLAAGSYSFQATYSGDTNYHGSTSGCEPFSIVAVVSQITPTQTTCAQFAAGSAPTLPPITYSTKGTTISQTNPGVLFYWVKVTVSSAGKQTFTITQSTTYSPATGTKLFAQASGSNAYNAKCGTLATTIGGTDAARTVTFTAATAGTYYIGIKYTTSAVVGSGPAATKFVAPDNYLYTFSTTGVAGSTSTIALNHK